VIEIAVMMPRPVTSAAGSLHQNQILPTGFTAGSPQEALDCACGLYLGH